MKIQDALDLHLKEEASRIIGEVSGCVSRQVEVADFDVGVLSQVGLHDLRIDILPHPKEWGFLLDGDVPPREC